MAGDSPGTPLKETPQFVGPTFVTLFGDLLE